jgi:hypothetical protein
VPEPPADNADTDTKPSITYDNIPSLDEISFDMIEAKVRCGDFTPDDYAQWLKYQFDQGVDYRFKGLGDLFPIMLTSIGRSQLRFMRQHLDKCSSSDYIHRKINEEYLETMTGKGILLDDVTLVLSDLGMDSLVAKDRVRHSKFEAAGNRVKSLREAGMIYYQEDRIKSDVTRVNALVRQCSGLEFKSVGQVRVGNKREKVYQLQGTDIYILKPNK